MDNNKITMITPMSFNEAGDKTANYIAKILGTAGRGMSSEEILLHSMLIGLTISTLKTYLLGDEEDIKTIESSLDNTLEEFNL